MKLTTRDLHDILSELEFSQLLYKEQGAKEDEQRVKTLIVKFCSIMDGTATILNSEI